MTATLAIGLPNCLTLQVMSLAELKQHSNFLPMLKYFELGEEHLRAGVNYRSSVIHSVLTKRPTLK
jgi:hypothetical protein